MNFPESELNFFVVIKPPLHLQENCLFLQQFYALTLMKVPVAQWIRHLTSNQEIPGSSPGGVAVVLVK